jgi:hypothetical protein
MVIGPIPPGTGVIALAIPFTFSKSTSPYIPSFVFIIPTSITIAFSFTCSVLISLGTPVAETKISACAVKLF